MQMKGAQAIVASLEKEGVEVVFGYPGGAVLPIYDALLDSPIRHVLTRHEQGAVHAADGYARVTGKVGVAMATSGPGATNLVTGIANAYMDSVPLVLITGQVPRPLIGKDSFQEVDITGITIPITKHNYLVKDPQQLPRIMREAFYIASTGRPGPVLVDVPRDVAATTIDYSYPEEVRLRGYRPLYEGRLEEVEKAAEAIAGARQPLFFVGGGAIIAGASAELRRLVEIIGAPVTSSLMGLGAFPGDHPLFLGMAGMHGTFASNMALTHADLVIGVGVRFDDRVTGKVSEFAPRARVIHLDIDRAEMSKNVPAHLRVLGHLKWSLAALCERARAGDLKDWLAQVREWQSARPLEYEGSDEVIKPQYVVEQVYEVTGGKAIVATDVGQHQMWTAQYYKFTRPRTLVTSGGLGTMGYGLPAGIGAQIGRPDELVFVISGDGSLLMNCQEIVTAVEQNLPIKVAICNNGYLGMVRQWQELFFNRRYAYSSLHGGGTDYARLAEALGAVGLRATRPAEVRPVLEQAMQARKPVFIDFRVAPEENVFPMVPAGAPIHQMIGA